MGSCDAKLTGESWPRRRCRPCPRWLRADIELHNALRALAQRRPKAVRSRVAAADDDDVLSAGVDRRYVPVPFLDLIGLRKVLHRLVDALQVAPLNGQIAADGRTDRQHHGVEAVQVTHGWRNVRAELGTLGHHLFQAAIDPLLLHLVFGHPVAHQTTQAVMTLKYGDVVARAGQLLGSRQAGRAGAHYGHRLARRE